MRIYVYIVGICTKRKKEKGRLFFFFNTNKAGDVNFYRYYCYFYFLPLSLFLSLLLCVYKHICVLFFAYILWAGRKCNFGIFFFLWTLKGNRLRAVV